MTDADPADSPSVPDGSRGPDGPHGPDGSQDPAPAARTPDAALAASALDPSIGTQARTFAWLFGLAGLCVLVCCGGGLAWVSSIEKSADPARVREIAAEVVRIDLPPRFLPAQAMRMPPPPGLSWLHGGQVDEIRYRVVPLDENGVPIVEPDVPFDPSNPAAPKPAPKPGGGEGGERGALMLVRLSGEKRGTPPSAREAASQMTDGEVRTVVTDAGRSIEFAFGVAADRPGDPAPGNSVPDNAGPREPGLGDEPGDRKVFGTFQTEEATYLIDLTLPPDVYDEAEVTAMLRSLEPVAPPAAEP